MSSHNSSLVRPIIIAVTIALSSFPLFGKTSHTHSVTDSTVQMQFGIDSTRADSLLAHTLESKRFVFRFSSHFLHVDQLRDNAPLYDAFCDSAARLLQLRDSSFKTVVCLFANREEWAFCVRGWPPPDRENRAVTFRFEVCSYGLRPIEHEAVHVLCNRFLAYSKSVFFAEGIEQYVEIARSNDTFRNAVRIAKKFLNEPFQRWASDSVGFWATPFDDSDVVAYPVSGLFVRYLIQRSGLDTFKEFYRRIRTEVSTEAAFSLVYGQSLSEATSDFKKAIASW